MNLKRLFAAVTALALLGALAACSSSTEDTTDTTETTADTTTTVEIPDVDLDMVVYTVGDREFTMTDYISSYNFNRSIMDINMSYYGITMDDLIADADAGDTYALQLQAMATEQLLYLAVMEDKYVQEGLSLDDDIVASQYDVVVANYGTEEDLAAELAGMGMNKDTFMDMLKSDLMSMDLEEIYMAEGSEYAPTDEEIRAYFAENYLCAKHVLISTVDDSYVELENQDELEALAYEVADLAQNGADFDSLVAEYGEDPGMEYYVTGYVFTDGEMVDEFYEGALALEEYGISDPIKSSYGWHIIQRMPLTDDDLASYYTTISDLLFSFEDLYSLWAEDYAPVVDEVLTTFTDAELVAMASLITD